LIVLFYCRRHIEIKKGVVMDLKILAPEGTLLDSDGIEALQAHFRTFFEKPHINIDFVSFDPENLDQAANDFLRERPDLVVVPAKDSRTILRFEPAPAYMARELPGN
jgi:hypothetical protein